jgi:hypothetical protein
MKNRTFLILLAVLPPLSVWAKPTKPNALFIAFDDLNDWVGFPDDHPRWSLRTWIPRPKGDVISIPIA